MTDREMLELAAKAAGIGVWFPRMADGKGGVLEPCHTLRNGQTEEWNPLTDDGDALRLAVRLSLHIGIDAESAGAITVEWGFDAGGWPGKGVQEEAPIDGDDYAATRRAIVRAAAEIGRAMKEAALRREETT